MDHELLNRTRGLYKEITESLIRNHRKISAMESCTGGLLASLLTDTPGASEVLGLSLITYSNDAKINSGVPGTVIQNSGVYSKETVCEMARSARIKAKADIGIGISGTLGAADQSNADSNPGEIWFAIDDNGILTTKKIHIGSKEDRLDGKLQTCYEIGSLLIDLLERKAPGTEKNGAGT